MGSKLVLNRLINTLEKIESDKPYYSSGDVVVRDSTLKDVAILGKHLRQADLDEVWASNHLKGMEALTYSFYLSSICLTILKKDVPIGMFGISPQGDKATIWLLGSDELDTIRYKLAKQSKIFVNAFLDIYPSLFNYVHSKNVKSIAWLKMIGAEFSMTKPYGVEGENFSKFYLERLVSRQ